MLLNYTFDALLQGQSIQSVEIERPIPIIESIQKIDIVRNINVILGVLDALNSKEWLNRCLVLNKRSYNKKHNLLL